MYALRGSAGLNTNLGLTTTLAYHHVLGTLRETVRSGS